MWTQFWPLLQAENNDGDFAQSEILLITQVSVGGEENFEARCFCGS